MSRFWLFPILAACLAGRAVALPGQPTQALILPLETMGSYEVLNDDQLTGALQSRLQQLAPAAQIQVARSAELNISSYRTGQDRPPTAAEAEDLARAYRSKFICWVDVHFNPSFQADTSTLAMAGAARLWVYNTELHRVTIDQPLSLVRTGVVKDVSSADASQAVADDLARKCVSDLGTQIFSIASQRSAQAQQRVANWAPVTAAPVQPAASLNYTAMIKAIKNYQKAVRDQSYMDQSSGESNLYYLWVSLKADEQKQIEQDYPGIAQMMTAPPAYGGGYWPYYYGRPGY